MSVVITEVGPSIAELARKAGGAPEPGVVLGIPNTGRLYEEGLLLTGCHESTPARERSLLHDAGGFVVVNARSNDLPHLLAHGVVDLVLTGRDYVVESGVRAEELWDFGFQRCRVCLLGPASAADWRERPNLRVATQYPGIAADFLKQHRPDSELFTVTGAAELYARLGLADVIIDAYMTGRTAAANGLVPLETVLETSGRLFARPSWRNESKDIDRVLARLVGDTR
ncbi:ATP phosphoribosyltransferase [Kitasatospora sp. NPDC058046]|uniref:ATP phosphoribosyltransferase n=1 Tax=Kitasatospora sp. NPDC058046 TaxID=3346312 RepID=UPI0036DB3D6B